jgi:hypothetical protein
MVVATGLALLLMSPSLAAADPAVSPVGQPNPVEVGQSVVFSASATTDPGALIIEYDWDFGDGDTCFDCGPSTSYAYQQEGQYTVTVTVTDSNFSTASGTTTIDVTPIPPPPSEQPSSRVHGGAGKITLGGRVGGLQLNRSTQADVLAFAGLPDATAIGNFDPIPHAPNYFALGYTCRGSEAVGLGVLDSSDYCETVFYINTRTKQLVGFHTSSQLYTFRGASPGMTTGNARRHMGRFAQSGCLTGFFFFGRHHRASLFGEVDGGRTTLHGHGRNTIDRVSGGHLDALELESNRHPVGLLFC